jgi:1-acyl-sn-glycerol-3-phosphate acyltransferase
LAPSRSKPGEFKAQNFTAFRRWTQLSTARYILWPLYKLRNNLTITGRENVPKNEPLLIVANHLSYFDPPLLVIAADVPMGFVAKIELFQHAKFAKLIEFYNAISINRGKPELSAVKAVRSIFKAGWSVGMFIEGTRSKTPGVLGPPHLGAAYFAKSNKVRILPIGLIGTANRGEKAYAHIGKPLAPSDDLEKTTWEVMEALSQLTGFTIGSRQLESD